MAGIENKETPSTQVGAPFRIKKIICASALAAATLFNSCGNDHTIKNLQDTTGIEQKDSTKYYCELVDLTQVIKEGEDGNKYVDDIYHYPIIEKDGKYYLIYCGLEFELNHCLIPNNHEILILGKREGIEYCLYDNEVYRVEEKTPSYIKISHIGNGPTIYISISGEHSKHYEENRVWNVRDY